jgi:hypothetical protein
VKHLSYTAFLRHHHIYFVSSVEKAKSPDIIGKGGTGNQRLTIAMHSFSGMLKSSTRTGLRRRRHRAGAWTIRLGHARHPFARSRYRPITPLPWKFALPLIVALSLALWVVIILGVEKLIGAFI